MGGSEVAGLVGFASATSRCVIPLPHISESDGNWVEGPRCKFRIVIVLRAHVLASQVSPYNLGLVLGLFIGGRKFTRPPV